MVPYSDGTAQFKLGHGPVGNFVCLCHYLIKLLLRGRVAVVELSKHRLDLKLLQVIVVLYVKVLKNRIDGVQMSQITEILRHIPPEIAFIDFVPAITLL
jgi:hypothetical protein